MRFAILHKINIPHLIASVAFAIAVMFYCYDVYQKNYWLSLAN